MKTATKKQEIELLEKYFSKDKPVEDPILQNNTVLDFIADLDMQQLNKDTLYFRCQEQIEKVYSIARKLPSYEGMQFFLEDMKLGWTRYFNGCNHPDSIFFRHYLKISKKITCQCCTYWRGRIIQFGWDALLGFSLLYVYASMNHLKLF